MWSWLASFLGGPIINGAIEAYKVKRASENDADRLRTELAAKELLVEIRAAELNAQIVIAEQGAWYTACIRPLFAAPFILFTWKIVVYDKVLGWGSTDPLDPNMWGVFMAVIIAFFGGRSIEKVARILKR